MKPGELRKGNLLQSDVNGDFDDHILKVDRIDDNIGAVSLNDGTHVYWGIENYKPIPLTVEKWVELGAHMDENNDLYIPYSDKWDETIRFYLVDGFVQLTKYSYAPLFNFPHINSVHRFQNLYSEMTGNELKTSLK